MQGTLDMLILRTLVLGPAHGHEMAKHIQRTTDDVLQVEHGSLWRCTLRSTLQWPACFLRF
jgi:PadR family transcriptional regulator PadR